MPEIPLPKDAPIEKVEEAAEEIVKEERAKADEKIEKVVQKEEEKPNGLIDLMSKALAKDSRTKQEK